MGGPRRPRAGSTEGGDLKRKIDTVADTVIKNGIRNQSLKNTQGIEQPLRKRLYTLKEASTYLGKTMWGIRSLVWSGKISYVKDGRKIWLDQVDLDQYIERMKVRFVG